MSSDKTYVVSFQKTIDSFENTYSKGLAAPYRDGFTFEGWAISETDAENKVVTYAASDLATVPNGSVLYAVWTQIN